MRRLIMVLTLGPMAGLARAEPPDLLELLKGGAPETVEEAIRDGAEVNARDENGES